jgi:hypothetical protein
VNHGWGLRVENCLASLINITVRKTIQNAPRLQLVLETFNGIKNNLFDPFCGTGGLPIINA